ncbi:unnamed protein product [marine sediment metagenome]|uniref:Uncharacterized protein n=1 Tax=marine sediment metagenome TaxID=412755 RepID=X1LH60_9ZZZZ
MTETRRPFPGRTKPTSPAPMCPVTSVVNHTTAILERRFVVKEIQPLLDDIDDEQKDRYGDDD